MGGSAWVSLQTKNHGTGPKTHPHTHTQPVGYEFSGGVFWWTSCWGGFIAPTQKLLIIFIMGMGQIKPTGDHRF